MHTTEIMYLV